MKRKLNNLKRHFRRWNGWRKRNENFKFHQILVLLKLANSPTFEMFLLPEELEMSFDYKLKPFEWVKEYFTTNNMSQTELMKYERMIW